MVPALNGMAALLPSKSTKCRGNFHLFISSKSFGFTSSFLSCSKHVFLTCNNCLSILSELFLPSKYLNAPFISYMPESNNLLASLKFQMSMTVGLSGAKFEKDFAMHSSYPLVNPFLRLSSSNLNSHFLHLFCMVIGYC